MFWPVTPGSMVCPVLAAFTSLQVEKIGSLMGRDIPRFISLNTGQKPYITGFFINKIWSIWRSKQVPTGYGSVFNLSGSECVSNESD